MSTQATPTAPRNREERRHPDSIPKLYDFADVAEYSGRTEKAIRQLRARGRGPTFRNIDGKLMCTEADLLDWVEQQIGGAA